MSSGQATPPHRGDSPTAARQPYRETSRAAVRHALNDLIFRNSPPLEILVNPLAIGAIGLALGGQGNDPVLIAFFVASLAVVLVNSSIWLAFRRDRRRAERPALWHAGLYLGAGFNGLVWGLGSAAVFAADTPDRVLLLIALAGFCGGYVASQSASLPSILAFVWLALVPLGTVAVLRGDIAFPALLLLYALALSFFARNNHRQQVETLRLRFENAELVDELTAAYEGLLASKQAAEAANHAKTDFLAHMSHELRTPLNAVIGFSDLIRHSVAGGDKRIAEYAENIQDSGQHLLEMISDLLDLSKIEAGRYELHEEPLRLDETADMARRQVAAVAADKGLRIDNRVPADLPRLKGDARATRQMLINLLSNAVKFTPPGGRVTLDATFAEGALTVEVADSGVGIAAANVPRILEPFTQVREAQSPDIRGTGLGLPLVKHLVELHGGRIEIDSAPGAGTTVRLRFPPGRSIPPPATPPVAGGDARQTASAESRQLS